MTSRQLKTKLDRAIGIIEQCEELLNDVPWTSSRWDATWLRHCARDFMDLHRQKLHDGGPQ